MGIDMVMKYRTHIVVTVAALATIIGGFLLFTPEKPTNDINTAAVKTVKPEVKKETTAPPKAAPTAPPAPAAAPQQVARPVVPIPPTPEANRTQLKGVIDTASAARISLFNHPFTPEQRESFIYTQWACVDRIISASVGYTDYNAAYATPASQVVLQMGQKPTGESAYRYFDGPGTCSVFFIPI